MKSAVLYVLHDHPLLQPRGEMDTAAYVELALHPPQSAYFVSPLYVYFLRLTGVSLMAARIVQILLGSVAVVLIFDTTRRWLLAREAAPASGEEKKRQRPTALQSASRTALIDPASIAAVLAILTGVITFYEVTVLQAALDPFLVSLTLWLLTIALQWQMRRTIAFAAAGAALGLLVLNRPNALLWVPLLAIGIAVTPLASTARLAGGWRAAVALVVGFAVPMAPVTIRNYAVAHEFVLIASHGGLNFFIGNNATADGTYHHVEGVDPTIAGQERDAPRVAAAAMHRPAVSASEASHFFYREAWRWIGSYPLAALALFFRKLAYTFNQTDLSLNYSYSYFTHDMNSPLKVLVVGPWLLFPLGLMGAVRLAFDSGRARATAVGPFVLWATFIPIYALSVAVFFVSSRYRLPLLIPMCIAAPAMFVRPLRAWQWLGAAILAVGVCWNFGLDDGRAHERTNMIVYLVEQHRFDDAVQLVDSTAAITRDPGTLFVRSAEAFEAAGDAQRATQIAGRVDPASVLPAQSRELAAIARRFAAASVRSDRPDQALAAFTIAHRLDRSDASDLLNIAVLDAQRGEFAAARDNAAAALRLRPGYAQAEGLLRAIAGR